jgi:hypothetical protein
MVPIHKITGRLGNQMFNYAFLINYAKTHGITDSYFPQHTEWFSESADYIKALYSQDIGKVDMVGIHVRRDDYLDPNRIQYVLPVEYYRKAMDMFPKDSKFIVCSDDIEWCKGQRVFEGCEFSEGKTEIEDMNLLASCTEGLIIANSTFSWWSAFLNPHRCLIVAPEKWDRDNKVFSMPDEWKVI